VIVVVVPRAADCLLLLLGRATVFGDLGHCLFEVRHGALGVLGARQIWWHFSPQLVFGNRTVAALPGSVSGASARADPMA
jgi:hypothetical protein